MRLEGSGPASMNPSALARPLDCANKARFSLSDEAGVFRLTSFAIVDVAGLCEIAEAYSRGAMVCEALPEYRSLFEELLNRITKERTASVG
jgi:hypothetical protein